MTHQANRWKIGRIWVFWIIYGYIFWGHNPERGSCVQMDQYSSIGNKRFADFANNKNPDGPALCMGI